jgi:hypothetical protein
MTPDEMPLPRKTDPEWTKTETISRERGNELHENDTAPQLVELQPASKMFVFHVTGLEQRVIGWHSDCSANIPTHATGVRPLPPMLPGCRTSPKHLPSQFLVRFAVANC